MVESYLSVKSPPSFVSSLELNTESQRHVAAAQNVRSGSSPGPTNDPDL